VVNQLSGPSSYSFTLILISGKQQSKRELQIVEIDTQLPQIPFKKFRIAFYEFYFLCLTSSRRVLHSAVRSERAALSPASSAAAVTGEASTEGSGGGGTCAEEIRSSKSLSSRSASLLLSISSSSLRLLLCLKPYTLIILILQYEQCEIFLRFQIDFLLWVKTEALNFELESLFFVCERAMGGTVQIMP
jgi:hypothetical protein